MSNLHDHIFNKDLAYFTSSGRYPLTNYPYHNRLLWYQSEDAVERILQDLGINYQRDVRTTKNNKAYSDIDFVLKKWYIEAKYHLKWVLDLRTVKKDVLPRFKNTETSLHKSKKKLLIHISPNKPTRQAFKLLRQSKVYLIWVKRLEDLKDALIRFILTHIRNTTNTNHFSYCRCLFNRYMSLLGCSIPHLVWSGSGFSVSSQFFSHYRDYFLNVYSFFWLLSLRI